MSTHEVVNQAPPRTDLNEYDTNVALREGVRRYDAAWAEDDLTRVGGLVGSAQFQQWSERANTSLPTLNTHDRFGHRVDTVDYDPAYHEVIAAAVEHGAHTSAWDLPKAGAHVARAATFMLFAQVEPGHACPISMTYSVVPVLRQHPDLAAVWEPRLLSRSYDPRPIAAEHKSGALFGMGMTEKQGGSDVRANTTVAIPTDGGGTGAAYLLTGHKWFLSAPMSDAFLVLAQTVHGAEHLGLSCFLMPRVLPDGTLNAMRIQRLKDKVGNKSNASSEIEFDGAWAQLVGEPGRGVRTIIDMVAHTRLDNVLGSTAGMRQATAEAIWHAQHRDVFGSRLVDQPLMTAVLADLCLETEAATATALRLARAHDEDADDAERAFRRLATAVGKYWITKRGPNHAYEAMECLGGNGYTESFPVGRRFREQPVMSIWEGSGNVIALDVMRALRRDPSSLEAFDAEVSRAGGSSSVFDHHLTALRRELADVVTAESGAERHMRRLTEHMALALQASLLIRHAPDVVADAFVVSRLGADRGYEYGTLPASTDVRTIVARHAGR